MRPHPVAHAFSRHPHHAPFRLHAAGLVLLVALSVAGSSEATAQDAPVGARSQPRASASAAPPITPTQTIRLFNGKNLDGFETWLVDAHHSDPLRVFSVVDQVDGAPAIRISGEQWGGLATTASYARYKLTVEFKWGLATWGARRNAARDSGVLVHAQGAPGNTAADGNGPWMRSIEAQIIEGGVGDFILVAGHDTGARLTPSFRVTARRDRDNEPVFDKAAPPQPFTQGRVNWWGRDEDWKDSLGFRGPRDVESPFGEWTRMEILVDADRIDILVNGQLVNAADQTSLRDGRIMIQSEGAEIFVRRIDLDPLPTR